jgi:hypothetical protein
LLFVSLVGDVRVGCALFSFGRFSTCVLSVFRSGLGRDLELALVDKGNLLTAFRDFLDDDLLRVSSWGLLFLWGCSVDELVVVLGVLAKLVLGLDSSAET